MNSKLSQSGTQALLFEPNIPFITNSRRTNHNNHHNKPFSNYPLFFQNNTQNTNNIIPISNRDYKLSEKENKETINNTYKPVLSNNDIVLNQISQVIQNKKKTFPINQNNVSFSDNQSLGKISFSNTQIGFKKNIPRNPFQNTQITSITSVKQIPVISDEKVLKKNIKPITHEFNEKASSVFQFSYYEDRNYPNRKEMQDFHKIIDKYMNNEQMGYFAILDGHGGSDPIKYANERLPEIVSKNYKENSSDITNVLISSFEELDNELKSDIEAENCGSTITLILVLKNQQNQKIIYSSNIGDSKGILISSDKAVTNLTTEHRCSNIEEAERIRNSGGIVFCGRMFGQLALSRALGDFSLKPHGLIATPSVSYHMVNENDLYIIMASDGVWDVLKEQDVMEICLNHGNRNCDIICKEIISEALRKGSNDNLSCITIKLQ